MVVAGIIAEYNPFHKGHQYHIAQTRKITGADYIITIMSPDFVQRGAPAMMDKHTRTQMALLSGADLVIELPLAYACSSAELFAMGSVQLLSRLGVVDYLSFGSESGNIEAFIKLGHALHNESALFQQTLKTELKKGLSFPVARQNALKMELPDYIDILGGPNNILGIEYCRALITEQSNIKPITIKRTSDNYHDTNLSDGYSSASAIRSTLSANDSLSASIAIDEHLSCVKDTMPDEAFEILKNNWLLNGPLCEDDFSAQLRYKLLSADATTLSTYLDVSKSLANRIIKSLNEFESFSQFAELLKSKDLTRTRINRALLHILLNIKQNVFDVAAVKPHGEQTNFIRVLGLRKSAQPLLHEIKKSPSCTLITKPAEMNYDAFAANLYESVLSAKYKQPFIHEYSKPVVII